MLFNPVYTIPFKNICMESDTDSRMHSLSQQNLVLLTEASRDADRDWGLYASTGGGYDSNVTLTHTDWAGGSSATS